MKNIFIFITLIICSAFSIPAYANYEKLDFSNILESACDETKCADTTCKNPGEPPAGCTIKKNCCCEVIDCFNRGMDMGRVLSVDLALKLCEEKSKNKKTSIVSASDLANADNNYINQAVKNIESLNHCFIGSDCGILHGLSCCTKPYFLINKKADLCLVKKDLEELMNHDNEKNCECAAKTEIPRPRYLRCNRENKCVEMEAISTEAPLKNDATLRTAK